MNVFKLLMQYQSGFWRGCARFCCRPFPVHVGESAHVPAPSPAPMLSFIDIFAILGRSTWVITNVKLEKPPRELKFKFQTGNQIGKGIPPLPEMSFS